MADTPIPRPRGSVEVLAEDAAVRGAAAAGRVCAARRGLGRAGALPRAAGGGLLRERQPGAVLLRRLLLQLLHRVGVEVHGSPPALDLAAHGAQLAGERPHRAVPADDLALPDAKVRRSEARVEPAVVPVRKAFARDLEAVQRHHARLGTGHPGKALHVQLRVVLGPHHDRLPQLGDDERLEELPPLLRVGQPVRHDGGEQLARVHGERHAIHRRRPHAVCAPVGLLGDVPVRQLQLPLAGLLRD
mmetsp:Transcript_10293/g.30128  ORF Transcript_10293/g.30128 Transcript_10293/m.30128 type:complete len:245 (-) Transcript_10293:10-744(-)